MANSIEVILNAASGSQRADEVCEILARVFKASGRSFHISVGKGGDIGRIAKEKASSDCEILVAGGGDGTICGVAQASLGKGKLLGVLPLGTFNYFAKNLGIPVDPEGAARVILNGKAVRASVLDLDGRLVLNNASIGIHPAVLLKRRELYRRWGRNQLNAYLSVLLAAFQPPPRLRVRLATAEGEVVRETAAVMICSNAFQMKTFALAGMECLETGKFALYVVRMSGRATIFRLGLRVVTRRLRLATDYEAICASEVSIEMLRRDRLRAAVDGELEVLQSPLRFRIAPQELLVLVPPEETST
ncbi:MAG TPA: diacylglycerol kinase family protein [Chthoniobacterales bacterium]|nr:diacylglycerol kinase family protein [Chthoniobacterales bacterium]